jgi:putative transposase
MPGFFGGRTIMKRTISEDVVPAVAGETAPAVPEAARRPLRELMDDRLLDALLERSRDQAGGLRLTGEGSMLGELVRAVLERALESELTAHLGYDRGGRAGAARNGNIAKTVQTGVGPVPLQVPRDRAGTFEPVLVPKRAGRVAGGLDDMVISLYAHGMSNRDIIATCGRSTGPSCRPRRSRRSPTPCWRR